MSEFDYKNLYDEILKRNPYVNLSQEQKLTLEKACKNAIQDHPNLNFEGVLMAVQIYLNFLLEFPKLSL